MGGCNILSGLQQEALAVIVRGDASALKLGMKAVPAAGDEDLAHTGGCSHRRHAFFPVLPTGMSGSEAALLGK